MDLKLETIVQLCKRRGFIYPSSSIYGGLQGFYDYGPLGIELKNNIKQSWWRDMVWKNQNIFGIDSAIITHKQTLKHSGHLDTFVDPLVECKNCHKRWRADMISGKCLACGMKDLTKPKDFNLMLDTNLGPVVEDDSKAYLRPETAQGIFTNFKHIVDTFAPKLPFGIAQIGKAFRNEITPKQFLFRVREFEQMELEFFVMPGEDEKWHENWINSRYDWWLNQGISENKLVLEKQNKKDLAHYSKSCVDILYQFPHGLEELEGIANRSDFDLGSHSKNQESLNLKSKCNININSVFKNIVKINGKEVVPYVIEPSAGVDRGFLALLCDAYTEDDLDDGNKRIYLNLKPNLAPIKAAIIPLAKNNPELVGVASKVYSMLQTYHFGKIVLENTGNIGKSYRKHDEIGTPICITCDHDTIDSESDNYNTLTVRDRNTTEQTRIPIEHLAEFMFESIFSQE